MSITELALLLNATAQLVTALAALITAFRVRR